MTLRWECDEFGDWQGHSGARRVAVAHMAYDGRDRWRWTVGPGEVAEAEGMADTPDAARAAAEAAWREWCRVAGLAPVGEAERQIAALRQALQHAVGAVEALGAVAEREHSAFAGIKRAALDAGYAALRATNRPGASGMVPPYKATGGEGGP